MADYTQEQLMSALRKAHGAGDQEGARRIAAIIKAQQQQAPAAPAAPVEPVEPVEPQVEAMKDGYSIVTTDRGRFVVNPQGQWQTLEVDGKENKILERALDRNEDDTARADYLARQAEYMTLDKSGEQGPLTNLIFGDNAARRSGLYGNILRGLPGAGSWVDEGLGKIEGALGGDGEAMAQRARDSQDAFEIAYPKTAVGAQLSGAALTLPYAAANAPRVVGGGSLLSKILRGGLVGANLGALEGFAYGAGEGQEGSRLDNAGVGAGDGAMIGGLLGLASPGGGALARTIYNSVSGRKARAAARELGMRQDIAGFVADRVAADAPYAARNISLAGDSAALGNLGPSTRGLLDAVANAPGRPSAIARKSVDDIVEGASGRFTQAFDEALGTTPRGPITLQKGIMDASREARGSTYDLAFSKPINYASEAGKRLDDLLSRVDKREIDVAEGLMRKEGEISQQLKATFDDAGRVTYEKKPDVKQIDYITRSLKNASGFGAGLGPDEARVSKGLASKIRTTLDEIVPEYKQARAAGADAIDQRDAVTLGRDMLKKKSITREDVALELEGMGDAENRFVRQGLRSYIDDTMADVRRGLTRSDIDSQSVIAPLRNMTSQSAREKVESVLGPEEASRLFTMLDEAEQAFAMRINVGSQTSARQQNEKAIRELVPDGLADEVVDKGIIGTASSMAAKAAKSGGQTKEQAMEEIRTELARTLTETGDVATRAQQFSDFADLGDRMKAGRSWAEKRGQQVAFGVLSPGGLNITRPEVNNRAAVFRRLADAGYGPREIARIVESGPQAIEQALTR